MRGEPIRPCPKPVKAEKAKRWGTRRKKKPAPTTADLAWPRPVTPEKTKHGRRERALGKMLFLSTLPCDVVEAFREAFGFVFEGAWNERGQPELRERAPGPCRGRVEVMHLEERGGAPDAAPGGRRGDDEKTAPGCEGHHHQIDGKVGGKGRWFVKLGWEGQRKFRRTLEARADRAWMALSQDRRDDFERRARAQRRCR